MVRSLYSGVTGMKGHQTRLDVIGNNIANVNTMGFKSSSTTFRDVYYQSLRGASAGNGTRGGVNSSMVGYGSKVSSVDVNMTQSISSTTGNPWTECCGNANRFANSVVEAFAVGVTGVPSTPFTNTGWQKC